MPLPKSGQCLPETQPPTPPRSTPRRPRDVQRRRLGLPEPGAGALPGGGCAEELAVPARSELEEGGGGAQPTP